MWSRLEAFDRLFSVGHQQYYAGAETDYKIGNFLKGTAPSFFFNILTRLYSLHEIELTQQSYLP